MEILMQNYGKMETWTFHGPLFINKKDTRENLLQINYKHGSRPK